jgi:hypothetical protein
MHNYSALSEGETIVIDAGGSKHWLDVVETRPSGAISLLGSVDLEVEFAPHKGDKVELVDPIASPTLVGYFVVYDEAEC